MPFKSAQYKYGLNSRRALIFIFYGLFLSGTLYSNQVLTDTFELNDIPLLKNKQTISLVAEKGFWTEHLKTELLPKFTQKTGVHVELISLPLEDMYSKQTNALIHGEGRYDLLTMEAGWSKEWASNGFTQALNSLAREYDDKGEAGMQTHLAPFYNNLLQILSYKEQYHSIPYNNYTMGNHYRLDLFEHPEEQKAFLQDYGYALSPPTSIKNLIDVSRFFTRSKGERLAGKMLENDFYGLTLMSGNRPHINDEFSSLLWGLGGRWLRPNYNEGGIIESFNVEANSEKAMVVARAYLSLLSFSVPADENAAFLESANAIANNQAAMWPFAYNNLWPISVQVEKTVPGAKLAVSTSPLGKPYTGAYAMAVAYDSKNPEAAYWLLKYITSFEGQLAYANGGGNPCRQDVVLLDKFTHEKHYPVSGAYQQNHQDNLAWNEDVLNLGHYTSTAMGKIYPELMRTAYLIRSNQTAPTEALNQLQQKIFELQNLHGEVAAFKEPR
jgi:multiple sugar transport system substrate-binding protein